MKINNIAQVAQKYLKERETIFRIDIRLTRAGFVTIVKLTQQFKAIICREQSETLSTNNGRFCNNSAIDTLI